MSQSLWRIFNLTANQYQTILSVNEPTQAENGDPIDTNQTVILQTNVGSPGYVVINSELADDRAIQILASDTNGGLFMDVGFGGILVQTTNAIQLNAAAASNLTTTNGNLTLRATVGLTNLDGFSGINIGNTDTASVINIGTAAVARNIFIGNNTGTTTIDIEAGSGGFNIDVAGGASTIANNTTGAAQDLNIRVNGATDSSLVLDSEGIGNDAILMFSSGGIDIDAVGQYTVDTNQLLQLTSNRALGNDITLQTPNGGILINAGVFGLAMDAVGTGVIFIGNFGNTGAIEIGNSGTSRNIIMGNTTGTTSLALRTANGLRQTQPTHTTLADADNLLTIANLITQILTIAPSAARTQTLPDAANVVANWANEMVNDAIDFNVINTGADSAILAMGVGGTMIGSATIATGVSGSFRLRLTNISGGSEAYTVYRLS